MRPLHLLLAAALVALAVPAATQDDAAPPAPTLGPTLVVLAKSGAAAALLDPVTGAERARLPVGVGPHEAATGPDGRTVVVCNYGQQEPGGTLTVIDTAAGEVVRQIELGRREAQEPGEGKSGRYQRFLRPHGIAFLPDGDRVVVTTEMQRRLLVVDVRRGTVLAAIPTAANISHMVALGGGATRAYVANIGGGSVSIVDLEKGELVKVVETGAGAEGIAVHPARPEVWVANRSADTLSVIDAESLEEVAELPCGKFPIRVAFTPDGARALVSCAHDGTVEVWDVTGRERAKTISMDEKPLEDAEGERLFSGTFENSPVPVGILVQPDGAFAYVANTQADVVTVIDLKELAIARRLKVGPEPDGMTWVPAR